MIKVIIMKITTKEVQNVTAQIDEIVDKYNEKQEDKKRDWRTYEQQFAHRVRIAYMELEPLVCEAVKSLITVKGETRGAKPELPLVKRVLLLLIKHIIQKSNRDMEAMLVLFSCLSDVDVSYKTIERLYSDQEVLCVLHNLHQLILRKKGVEKVDGGGDGTGYALTVKKNYESEAQKLKDQIKTASSEDKTKKHKKRIFIYAFNLIDIKTNMYVATGTSFKSEKKAFESALAMAKDLDIDIESLRLDKYYSAQKYVKRIEYALGTVKLYLIPKKNATIKGSWTWKRMLYRFVQDTEAYLKEYFQRNKSESGFAQDKKRCGWKLGQKREDRLDTANFLTSLWHNLYNLG